MRPQIDDTDRAAFSLRVEAWNKRTGPRVGDFIEMLDGTTRRFAHNWDEHGLQVTCGDGDKGSFYFDRAGVMSMSGSLDPTIPLERIEELTGKRRSGWCWFFHHDFPQAHSAVHFTVPCRVYRQV
jgi:hypothetical protein